MLVIFVSGKDVLEKMKRDELVLSMSLRVGMGNPSIEVASKLGFDYVYFDFEHGVLEVETFAQLIRETRLAGLIALCRVPELDAAFVNRVLDAGVSGIVFPHVKTKQDAMRAVELTKYRTNDRGVVIAVLHDLIDLGIPVEALRIGKACPLLRLLKDVDGRVVFERTIEPIPKPLSQPVAEDHHTVAVSIGKRRDVAPMGERVLRRHWLRREG